MVNWGILGAARIAKEQMIPAILKNDGHIYALASKNGNDEDLQNNFHFDVLYRHYEQLLDDPLIEIVYIALPNHLHFEWTKKALLKNKHVLCEKPMTTNVKEAIELHDLAEKQQCHLFEGFMYQYHPQIEVLKQMIDQGILGELQTMKSSFHFLLEDRQKDIRMQKAFDGGALNDLGCYLIHIQNLILQEEYKEIQVMSKKEQEVDVMTTVQIEYTSGLIAQMDCSFNGEFTQVVEIIGTKGSIRLPRAFRTDMHNGVGIIEYSANGSVEYKQFNGDAYAMQIEAIHEFLNNDKEIKTNKIRTQAEKLQQIQRLIGGK